MIVALFVVFVGTRNEGGRGHVEDWLLSMYVDGITIHCE